ncbi:TolC family protein [Sulfuriferula sp. GW1]|uniref:TolC family protein n=1 Tax=Sulfuriferula sp. GW1 TaxID=3345111 RepID=UPI0039B0E632
MQILCFNRVVAPLFVVMVTLAGCASYAPRPLSPQATASAFEARTLSDPGLENYLAAHLPRTGQAESSHTWDLNKLTLAALYYHPDLEVARAQQNVAKAGVQVSRQRPNPSLNLTPAYNANAIAGMSPWILGTMLNFPIETAGRRGYREAQANHQLDDARFHVAEVAWQVRSHVRGRMLDYDAALREAAILKQTLALRENLLQAVQRRLAAGEAGQAEVDTEQAALADVRLQLDKAWGRGAAARVALAAAVGVPVAALDSVKLSFAAFNRPLSAAQIPAPAVRRAALTNRADLLAALARYEVSQSALQLEIARQYPDLQIGPGYKWDQGANKWSLGISLTLPLFNQNQGQIAQATAQRELAAARFTALQTRAIAQTGQALADYRAALAALDSAQSLAAIQQLRAQSAQRQFSSGYIDHLALDQARLQTLAAENTRLTASIQAQRALGALEDAVQQPLDGSIQITDPALPDPRRDAPAHQGSRP